MTSKRSGQRLPLMLSGLLVAATAGTAQAQSGAPAQALLDSPWVFNVGVFVLNNSLKANLNGSSGNNPEVDFDETFGRGNDATRFRADVMWRITPAHHLRFMYFDNTVNRSKVIDEAVEWGDYTFSANGRVDSRNQFVTAELAYEYAFMRQPSYEVAASIGVHVTEAKIKLSGDATFTDSNGNSTPVSGATQTSSVTAPLPVIGLRAGWVVAPNWYIDAQAQFFKLKYDNYDGNWSDLRVSATWMYNPHFGIGLGYNRFATNVEVEKNTFDGRLRTSYSGLQAYLTGAF
jgi:hypothetical protein